MVNLDKDSGNIDVSIVIPAKDEQDTIGILLDDINKVINKLPRYRIEVVVAADHCVDNTVKVAKAKGVSVIENDGSPGKGNALKKGFVVAKGCILIMMDADYSHRAEEIPKLLEKIEEGAGLVIGSRFLGGSDEYSPLRHFGNVFLTFCFRLFFHIYLKDTLNGFKGFKREIFDNYEYSSSAFEIEIELLANALRGGYSIFEFPSYERARRGGRAKSSVPIHGFKFLWMIIKKGIQHRIFVAR